jgi:hypothetical protein
MKLKRDNSIVSVSLNVIWILHLPSFRISCLVACVSDKQTISNFIKVWTESSSSLHNLSPLDLLYNPWPKETNKPSGGLAVFIRNVHVTGIKVNLTLIYCGLN